MYQNSRRHFRRQSKSSLVTLTGCNSETFRNSLSPLLPVDLEPIELLFVNQVPRMEMGKTRRAELVRALRL